MAKASIEITAQDKTKAAFDSARKNLAGLGEQAAALPARFGTLGIAIAAAFSAVSVKSVIDGADQLNKLSQKTGIAVEALSELKYAGSLADVSIESIALGVKKLSSNMFEAASGGKEAAETFDLLGVAFKNGDGSLRDSDKVLADIAERFAGLADGPEKSALAVKTFGKAGADLIPLLNAGKDGLEAMRIEARQLGVVISTETAKAAEEFNDNLTRMAAVADSAKIAIANGILPTIVQLTNELIAGKKAFGSYWGAFVELGLKTNPFDNWSDNAKKAADDVKKLAAEVDRLEVGRRATASNEGGAAFVGASGTNAGKNTRLPALQKELAAAEKRKAYFDKLIYDSVSKEAARLEKGDLKTTLGKPPKTGGVVKVDNSAEKELEKQAKLLQELSGLTGSFAEDWQRLNDIFKKGSISLAQLTEAQSILLSKQPAVKAQAEAEQKLLDIREKNNAVMRSHADTLAANNAELIKSNRSLLDEVEEIGLNAEALAMLRMARIDANIAREEENLLQAQSIEGNELEVAQMERALVLLKEQRLIKKDGIVRQQRADEIEEAKKRTDTISESISDGILDGFRNGKGLGDIFLNELKAQFAKTVLQPVIKPIVEAGNQLVSEALKGISGGGGGGGLGSFAARFFGGGGGGGFMNDAGGMELAGSLGFDGGGYTGDGLRTGGLDGKGGFMAMMHPQETVVDHTKGQTLGGKVTNNYNFGSGVTRSDVMAGLLMVRSQAQSDQSEIGRRRRGA